MTTIRKLMPVEIAIAAMTYNQPEMLQALEHEMNPYLITIDNGSNPEYPNATIRVPENRYFAGGWNYAMHLIEGDWVAMLNDDLSLITARMISELVDQAERNGYSAISPAFNSPHWHSQPQGVGLRNVPAIDWVATIIRKSAWDEVGGFNAEYFPGYGSDLDISYRLKQAGHRLAVDDRYIIHHIGGVAAVQGGTQHIQGNVAAMNESFQKLYNVPDWMQFMHKYLGV